MLLFPESGPKKNFRVTASLKPLTPHLRSIVPNVQQHMAYFAPASLLLSTFVSSFSLTLSLSLPPSFLTLSPLHLSLSLSLPSSLSFSFFLSLSLSLPLS